MFMDSNWKIIAEDGKPSKTAPDILASMKLGFCVIGYHITGDPRMKCELSRMLLNANRSAIFVLDINYFNQFTEYFGNNLSHTYWYNILRLGKVYFSENDYKWLLGQFNKSVHTYCRLSHNAWFNGIYMSQGGWTEKPGDPYKPQLIEDLTDFWDAPNVEFYQSERDKALYTLDPTSVWLDELYKKNPLLQEVMGDIDPQAKNAFPVKLQCSEGFLWQRNPFRITECGSDNPRYVQPGVDFIVAYWLASYHKFITKDM